MYRTTRQSSAFDPERVVDPERRGGVAWGQFNENFKRLQATSWRDINAGTKHGLLMRLLRAWLKWGADQQDTILDLQGKARAFWQLDLPRDPDIVFFGAEAGWEASIVQALFGDGGHLTLIDNDPAAYERFLAAEEEVVVKAPRGFGGKELVVRRDHARIEYLQADFFDVQPSRQYDVGIDWGIIEHYCDERKIAVLENFKRFIKNGGVEITSTPRDTVLVRLWYYAFREEMNFGYRELLDLDEVQGYLRDAGLDIEKSIRLPAHNIVASRVRHPLIA